MTVMESVIPLGPGDYNVPRNCRSTVFVGIGTDQEKWPVKTAPQQNYFQHYHITWIFESLDS